MSTRQNAELSPADKERALRFIQYLLDHFEELQDKEEIPFSWTREAVGNTGTGYDPEAQALVFVQWDGKGKAVGLKQEGSIDINPRLWPLNIHHPFDPGAIRWIVFVENERAAISLQCWRIPVVCSSGGVENLPDDLSWLGHYGRVLVVLSNDEGGWQGMLELADAILQQCPDTEVLLCRWPAGTPSGSGVEEYCEIEELEGFKRQVLEQAVVYLPPTRGVSPLRFASGPDRKRQSEEKVEIALKSAGGELNRTALMRKTRLSKCDLNETLASLEERGLVNVISKPRERPQGGGRPIVVVSWVER